MKSDIVYESDWLSIRFQFPHQIANRGGYKMMTRSTYKKHSFDKESNDSFFVLLTHFKEFIYEIFITKGTIRRKLDEQPNINQQVHFLMQVGLCPSE